MNAHDKTNFFAYVKHTHAHAHTHKVRLMAQVFSPSTLEAEGKHILNSLESEAKLVYRVR